MRNASSARPCEVDRAVGVAAAEIAFGLAHRLTGAAELVRLILAFALPFALALLLAFAWLALAEAVLAQLFQQFIQAVAQRLLVLLQVAHLLL